MARRRFQCERCGGTGHQEAGCWDGKGYNSPEGVCQACGGEGLLGEMPESDEAEDCENPEPEPRSTC